MKKIFFTFILLFYASNAYVFEKVVMWGHKLHSHTHSYIHNAFFRAFSHMGYKTYWFDDKDDVSNFDFSNSLFITEGSVDKNIPLREDCFYILHNCYRDKYEKLIENKRTITLQVYTDSCRKYPDNIEVEPFIFYNVPGRAIYFPWATDLLPHEIDIIKDQVKNKFYNNFLHRSNLIVWVGTIGGGEFGNENEINPFKRACKEHKIKFIHRDPWHKGTSLQENIKFMMDSYIAPAIVGTWQERVGYIPCRIFKNISYGNFGVTNCKRAYELFEGKIIYNKNTYQLFYDTKNFLQKATFQDLENQMNFVRDNHTYINRINSLLKFIDMLNN